MRPISSITILTLIWGICMILASLSPARAAESFGPTLPAWLDLKLDVPDSANRMVTRAPDADGKIAPANLRLTLHSKDRQPHELTASFTAAGIDGKPLAWKQDVAIKLPAIGKPIEQLIPIDAGFGYYAINIDLAADGAHCQLWTDVGIIPPPWPGLRPESFFQSNTSKVETGAELAFVKAMGIKVMRGHFEPEIDPKAPAVEKPTGQALPENFSKLDAAFSEAQAAGEWYLPMIGYSLPVGGRRLMNEPSAIAATYGPPRDLAEFCATWEQTIRHYPQIRTWELWNEPWIYGWTWTGSAQEYRDFQTACAKMIRGVDPKLRILAFSSSPLARDVCEPYPQCWKGLVDGLAQHPYAGVSDATNRSGQARRLVDDGFLLAKRMGIEYWLTEGGTSFTATPTAEYTAAKARMAAIREEQAKLPEDQKKSPHAMELGAELTNLAHLFQQGNVPDPNNCYENTTKLVQYFVTAALDGCFAGNAQQTIGYGPNWTQCNTALAVLTHALEDRPIVADIWPSHELIWGAIFANPKFVTPEIRALPRAEEIGKRWQVPIPADRQNDTTKVAVIWALTGPSQDNLDTVGTLTIANAAGLKAFDIVGQPIPSSGDKLTVPFGNAAVYITSDTLSVVDLRERIANATIQHITPLNAYAQSLMQPADQPQTLTVRVESQLNRDITGTLAITIPGGKTIQAPLNIPAGKLIDVAVPWPGVAMAEGRENQYPIKLTATADDPALLPFHKDQAIAAARFAKRTINVDGTLDGWQGITPVLLDSKQIATGLDLAQYFLNPHLEQPTGDEKNKRIVARIYTAYDDANVYIAAAVNEDTLSNTSGQELKKGRRVTKYTVPYKSGVPDGIQHIALTGCSLQFSFGFRDRLPGLGREMTDPWAWKGEFYDTDYSYAAHVSANGDQLVRLWGSDDNFRRDAYQTDKVPGVGPIDGAKIKITRNEDKKLTIYELSIPRSELKLFDPTAGKLRFGFVLNNDEGINRNNGLNWGEAAGVFDYWRNPGSYPPHWLPRVACQTTFGIEK